MSASPTNSRLGLTEEVATNSSDAAPASETSPQGAPAGAPSHEALQALLAFSSLHEQIRQRRIRELRDGAQLASEDAWELEQFVLDEVLQLVAERALTITGSDGVAIALAENNEIICRASSGEICPDPGARLDPNSGFSGACFRTGQIIRCDDAENDPRVNVQAARRLGARSMVAVPLLARSSVIGLLEAFSYDAYGFNDSDVRSLNLLAELILAAIRPEEEDRLAEISRRVVSRSSETAGQFPSEQPQPATSEALPQEQPRPAESSPSAASHGGRWPGLWVVLLVIVIAMAIGAGLWWRIRNKTQSETANNTARTLAAAPQPAPEEPPIPAETGLPAPSTQTLSGLPLVTGIRHWSSRESSTVVIDLQDQVQYEAHRLTNPERIYFDLHDTNLAPGLAGKPIEISDGLIVRVRVAQPVSGVTRVVLETRNGSNFSVSLEPNPYRIVVEVRAIGVTAGPKAKVDLFGPALAAPAQTEIAKSLPKPSPQVRAHPPTFRLVLDAGHGGWDLGTVGRKGLLEKDLVLDIVQRLGQLVGTRLGTEVIYTRQDDNYIALEKRAEIANQAQADLFLSVHANYSDSSSARGVETYYTNTFSSVNAHPKDKQAEPLSFATVDIREKVQESHKLAATIQQSLYKTLAAKNPGLRNRGVKEASYVVLTGTTMPAILAEVSFVSSPTDESNLQSSGYRQQIAEALYQGLVKYVSAPRKVKMASASTRAAGQ